MSVTAFDLTALARPEGYKMANQEQLAVPVGLSIRKVVPFSENSIANFAAMWEAHMDLPIQPQVDHLKNENYNIEAVI